MTQWEEMNENQGKKEERKAPIQYVAEFCLYDVFGMEKPKIGNYSMYSLGRDTTNR